MERIICIVISGENADQLDQVAEQLEAAISDSAETTTFPEGIKVEDIFTEDPDAPDDEIGGEGEPQIVEGDQP